MSVALSSPEFYPSIYNNIRETLEEARRKTRVAVNEAMVTAYWEIGRQIVEAQGERAEYGKRLIEYLSERLTKEFGKGFTVRNLWQMKQFYIAFPIVHALRAQLSWTHYRQFLDLKEDKTLRESDLEQALIDRLQDFMLELGKGFSFVARQKRISDDTDHYYIDLVFYNYMLKCLVLVDLKTGKLTPQDVGQMDFYVRLYEDQFMLTGDNPPVGIILCAQKNCTVAKYSALSDKNNLFASQYMTYLPTEEELARQIGYERRFLDNRESDEKEDRSEDEDE